MIDELVILWELMVFGTLLTSSFMDIGIISKNPPLEYYEEMSKFLMGLH